MRCFGKLPGILDRDHIINEEAKPRIGNTIRPNEDIITSVRDANRGGTATLQDHLD